MRDYPTLHLDTNKRNSSFVVLYFTVIVKPSTMNKTHTLIRV